MILIVVFFTLLAYWLHQVTKKPKNFPPGPPRLPFVGSLPFMTGSEKESSVLHGHLKNINQYGPIVGFYFGRTPAVLLADYELVKETFKNENLSARPSIKPGQEARPGWQLLDEANQGKPPGVIFTQGQYWKDLRRFLLKNLRDLGFGKSSMEELIQEEVGKLCQLLGKNCNQVVDLSGTFNISIVNSLWSLITGEKLDLDDPSLERIISSINVLVRTSSPISPLAAMLPDPNMVKWPILSWLSGFDVIIKTFGPVVDLMRPYISEHSRTLDSENPRDLLDSMIIEEEKVEQQLSCFKGLLGRVTTVNVMADMFFAGMETTSSSIYNLILQLLHHPNVQERLYEEIEKVIGKNRFPLLEDKGAMPFMSAVLQESFRVSSIAFAGVPRSATEDIKVKSYIIPEGATVFASLYAIHHDEKRYPDPDVFNPDRFIDKFGHFIPDERIIPFGTGKRICIGQSLAEKQFFLFTAALIQQFKFEAAPGHELPSYKNDIFPKGFIRKVSEYRVLLKKRFE